MRWCFAQHAFEVMALVLVVADASAQSRCASAKVSEIVFEQRTQFSSSVRGAKTLFVGVYHNLQSGLIDPPPHDSIDDVKAVLKQWLLVGRDEQAVLLSLRAEMTHWGRYLVTSDMSKADLILIAKLGRDKTDFHFSRRSARHSVTVSLGRQLAPVRARSESGLGLVR
jgi:hypothetical protein